MKLQVNAAGFSATISTPSLLFYVHFRLTRNINVSSLPCCFVSLSPFSLSLSLRLSRTFMLGGLPLAGPVSAASTCLRCGSFQAVAVQAVFDAIFPFAV